MAVDEEDLTQLDDAELERNLLELETEEREVSARRRKLHDRLASFPNPVATQQEQELSTKRRALHVQIDALRAERSRRREDAARDS